MAGSKSHMIENPREEVLSTDLTRIGKLAAREQQDADRAKAVRADFYVPGTFDDFDPSARSTASAAIPGLLSASSLLGATGSFDMLLGAGEAETDTSDIKPDLSVHQVARWDQQVVPWPLAAQPDGALYKIATIYVSPTDTQTDLLSRNILLDPATRSFAPQNVYKTSNPSAVVAVAAGTAAVLPFPPALPPDTIPLFDVLMPPGTTQSSDWQITRRCSRRIEFPGSSQHGILKGCVPAWNLTDESTGSPAFIPLGGIINRPVIDGEMLTFGSPAAGAAIVETNDTGAGALTAAPATHDLPYYLYLCGGRNFPFCGGVSGSVPNPYNATPVVLVASLTVPDAMGYPKVALGVGGATIPRNAAIYVGIGFIIAGGTVKKCCAIEEDWVHALTIAAPSSYTYANTGFNEPDGGVTNDAIVGIETIPATATMVDLEASIFEATLFGGAYVIQQSLTFAPQHQLAFGVAMNDGSGSGYLNMRSRSVITDGNYFISCISMGTYVENLHARAYNMNVPRLAR